MASSKTTGKGMPSSTMVDFEVKPPFRIMEDNRRRFIRIDIDEPVTFCMIKSTEGAFWPDGDGPQNNGEILNISAGGILMYTTEPVMEQAVLLMSLRIEGCDAIDNILCLVKRTEIDSGGYLVGMESITRERLADILNADEIALLPKDAASFTERMQALLNQYLYARKLAVDGNNGDRH
jgi:hypothetical protein